MSPDTGLSKADVAINGDSGEQFFSGHGFFPFCAEELRLRVTATDLVQQGVTCNITCPTLKGGARALPGRLVLTRN